jgi:hypothetical protein
MASFEDLEKCCDRCLCDLLSPIEDDPIQRCGDISLVDLSSDPDNFIVLANEKLHVFPFKDVDICWRRLYTDASIVKALHVIKTCSSDSDTHLTFLDDVVKTLDMAFIMTGAPCRREMIDHIFEELERFLSVAGSPPAPINMKPGFPKEDIRIPEIVFPIVRRSISFQEFEQHLNHPVPLIIRGVIDRWPALHERHWDNPSYFMKKMLDGRRLVPVELGRSYTDDGWGQRIITFKEFMNMYLSNSGEGEIGYLAQHDLFAQIPSLRNDISIPDFCFSSPPPPSKDLSLAIQKTPRLEEPLINAWFGPQGTISPLHTDPYHNILCQVVGKKYVRLYPPHQSIRLYPRGTEDGVDMSNTSRVPIELVEMQLEDDLDGEFGLFGEASYVEAVLNEGDSLYIPVGWWHYVRSLTVSFSVSFWWN